MDRLNRTHVSSRIDLRTALDGPLAHTPGDGELMLQVAQMFSGIWRTRTAAALGRLSLWISGLAVVAGASLLAVWV